MTNENIYYYMLTLWCLLALWITGYIIIFIVFLCYKIRIIYERCQSRRANNKPVKDFDEENNNCCDECWLRAQQTVL